MLEKGVWIKVLSMGQRGEYGFKDLVWIKG